MGILVLNETAGAATVPGRAARASVWARFKASFLKSRVRAADREIARHLARNPQLAQRLRDNGDVVWKQAADALPF